MSSLNFMFIVCLLKVVSNLVDFGMDPQSALDAPRFCVVDVDSSLGPRCVRNSR